MTKKRLALIVPCLVVLMVMLIYIVESSSVESVPNVGESREHRRYRRMLGGQQLKRLWSWLTREQYRTMRKSAAELNKKGTEHFMANEYAKAVEYYERARQVLPERDAQSAASYLSNEACALNMLAKYREALERARQALQLNPNNKNAKDQFILSHFGLSKEEYRNAALRDFEAASKRFSVAKNNTHQEHELMEQMEEALAVLQRKAADTWDQSEFERALENFESLCRNVSVVQCRVEALSNRALFLNRMNEYAKALHMANEALAIDAQNTVAREQQANAQEYLMKSQAASSKCDEGFWGQKCDQKCGVANDRSDVTEDGEDLRQFGVNVVVKRLDIAISNFSASCVGVFIDKRTILIAAQCLDFVMDMSTEKKRPLESQLQVDLIGSANSAKQILVEKIVIHEKYDRASGLNDIALLRLLLEHDMLVTHSSIVCLPHKYSHNYPIANTSLYQTTTNDRKKVIKTSRCVDAGRSSELANKFCAENNEDECESPVLIKSHDHYTVAGLASTKFYTRVSAYTDWIRQMSEATWQLISSPSEHSWYLSSRAFHLNAIGSFDEALALATQALSIDPKNTDAVSQAHKAKAGISQQSSTQMPTESSTLAFSTTDETTNPPSEAPSSFRTSSTKRQQTSTPKQTESSTLAFSTTLETTTSRSAPPSTRTSSTKKQQSSTHIQTESSTLAYRTTISYSSTSTLAATHKITKRFRTKSSSPTPLSTSPRQQSSSTQMQTESSTLAYSTTDDTTNPPSAPPSSSLSSSSKQQSSTQIQTESSTLTYPTTIDHWSTSTLATTHKKTKRFRTKSSSPTPLSTSPRQQSSSTPKQTISSTTTTITITQSTQMQTTENKLWHSSSPSAPSELAKTYNTTKNATTSSQSPSFSTSTSSTRSSTEQQQQQSTTTTTVESTTTTKVEGDERRNLTASFKSSDTDKVSVIVGKPEDLSAKKATALNDKGVEYMKRGDYSKAAEYFQLAILKSSNDSPQKTLFQDNLTQVLSLI